MFWNYLILLEEVQWKDIIDIGLASIVIWVGIHALRTARTRKIGVGLLLYGTMMLTAGQLELKLTVWLLQGITAVIVLIVVVAYQSEIRRFLERFPSSVFKRSRLSHEESLSLAELLADAIEIMSKAKQGALIILPGSAPLDSVITAGTALDGALSKALLLSIFDPNSPGHDGAIVIHGNRVERFGSHLPLSDRDERLRDKGTRHAAALGLSEKTDALVLVVSEETGGISLACEGLLRPVLEKGLLLKEIEGFLEKHSSPAEKHEKITNITLWRGFEYMAALTVATVLWLVLVPGTVIQTEIYEIAVEVQNIPEGFDLVSVTPTKIAVTLSAEKRNLFKIRPDELLIPLDGTLTRFGRQTYPITNANLLLPPNVEIADLTPEQVRVIVRKQN